MPGSGALRGWSAAVAAVAVLAGVTVASLPVSVQAPYHSMVELPLGRSATPFQPRDKAVAALLEKRAEAVRARDEQAFLSSVDPKSPPDFQLAQRALFHDLAEVPVAEWSYELEASASLSPPPLPDPPEDSWAPRVTLSYALAGVDRVPTRRSLGYLFAKRGNSWYLAGDEQLRDQGRRTWRGPWDFGACRVRATARGLVIGHDGNRELADRISRVMDASVAEVTAVWGPDWSRQVAVLLPDSHPELRELVGPEFAVDGIAAVTVADRVDAVARRVEGVRVVFNGSTAANLSDTALRVVLQHEITHVAARADTVDGAPMWMLEGFADYVGYRGSGLDFRQVAPDLASRLRTEGPPARLPSDRDFHAAGRELDLAYQKAWSLVSFLGERIGQQRLVELYHRVAGSTSPSTVENAFRETAGMSAQQVLAEWGEWLDRTSR